MLYEFQVKYNTGWETLTSTTHPNAAEFFWGMFKTRFKSIKTRMVVDGKVARRG